MDQQTHQTSTFVTPYAASKRESYLDGLFEAIDELIVDCAEVNNVDLTQLKRFVAGHVAMDDMNEFLGKFQVFEKKKAPCSDWNALVGIAMNRRKRTRIDTETIECAQQLREELNGDGSTRNEVLRAEVDERKKELEKKKLEKTKKMEDDLKKKKFSCRQAEYIKDMAKLNKNMSYMLANYGSHMITISANENRLMQASYPPFAVGNSGTNKYFPNSTYI
jgi:hypothetical protein